MSSDNIETPIIQILEKEKYFNQYLVPLPEEVPYPPLTAESTVRVRTRVMSLTANNLAYAQLGFLLNWWDPHPLPSSTPASLNDSKKYGRTNCWGYGEVLESTAPGVPKGSYLWGYLPLGTLAQDLTVKESEVPNHVFVTNEYRQNIFPIYNRYLVFPASLKKDIDNKSDSVAMDSVVRVMFETSYLVNRFLFAETLEQRITPGPRSSGSYDPKQADLDGATVVVLAPGSKVALAFAWDLKHGRKTAKVKRVVGAASDFSKAFVEGTGLYDEVVSTTNSPQEILSRLAVNNDEKIFLVDFGGRAGSGDKWATEIGQAYNSFTRVNLAVQVNGSSQEEVLKSLQAFADPKAISPNASDMRDEAMAKVGENEYFKNLDDAWIGFRDAGIKGLAFKWGESMEEVKNGWDALCKGETTPAEGLVYLL